MLSFPDYISDLLFHLVFSSPFLKVKETSFLRNTIAECQACGKCCSSSCFVRSCLGRGGWWRAWGEATPTVASGWLAPSWREGRACWETKLRFVPAVCVLLVVSRSTDCCFSLGPLSFQSPTPNTLMPPAPPAPPTPPIPPVRRCDSNSCFRGVRCMDTRDGFQCGPCPDGYTGNGVTCSDIDEVTVHLDGVGAP